VTLRHERATEELRELAALYALGSLTQQEARSFELHRKEGCSVCEAEFRKFERAVAGIGLAADEAASPEYIRDLLAARMEREPQTAQPTIRLNPVREAKAAPESVRPAAPPPFLSLSTQPSKNRTSLFPWILVAALTVVALWGLLAYRETREANTELRALVSAAKADSDDLRAKFDSSKEGIASLEQIVSLASKPGARMARLVVQAAAPAFSAALIWDTDENQCLLFGHFAPAPEGKNYQLWFFTPATKVSAGSFKVNAGGRTLVTLPVPRDASGAGAVVITLEPDNGSQIPTSPYYAAGRIE
jgi:hypothetical protein